MEKLERAPCRVVEATETTFEQLPGLKPLTLALELPAATTTVVPRLTAELMALWYVEEQLPLPPRLMLMTSAGLALDGTPLTLPPDAQTMPSAMSDR